MTGTDVTTISFLYLSQNTRKNENVIPKLMGLPLISTTRLIITITLEAINTLDWKDD